ncbi:M14 family zinc carboxypeptidase [Lutibacter sp. TH_r2]|uniref:M14 family zinc carboxypeptidase n=1 Tax=Lutibacter sp. TH_r2 TaxID=3082083 RepID=UPI0029548282|nr:M14 family zinc carboxypeptidase [Lutibacter sp. TH_r2]MDV7188288.1 M14 family zinc carboxypeptidase [Lutibacter sp. TH_r2]
MDIQTIQNWYKENFENNLSGRRILFTDIEALLNTLPSSYHKKIIGNSENGIPIYQISIGSGKTKVLIWSQMHGNESTGTKAMFDLFKFLADNNTIAKTILNNCELVFIPLLNPDGAIRFTRENANGIDLNRDAVDRLAVESNILRNVLDNFNPQFCFNLHDQRSIFNPENSPNPATLSFLAPSISEERELTNGRIETMSVIVAINKMLQKLIPGQIGRYTDEFYPTATGDNFQKLGHNTILFEAGHFPDDYDREKTREYNFYAMLQGLYFLATANSFTDYKDYFNIPNNDKKYLDIIYRNLKIPVENKIAITDIGIQFKFKVLENKLHMYKAIETTGNLSKYYANSVINAEKLDYLDLELSNS